MYDTDYGLSRLTGSFAGHTSRSEATVSRLATGSGETMNRLRRGHTITLRRVARVLQWFSDHWPADLEWPSDIPRPLPSAPTRDHPQEAA